MSEVTAVIQIDVPPQQVFDTVMDPRRLGDWVTIHRRVTVGDGDPVEAGAQMDQVLSLRGVSVTIHWTLTSVRAPELAQWEGRGPAGSSAQITYRITGPEAGPTRFEYANEFTAPGGAIGKAASRVVVGGVSQREAQASLAKLKALLEG